MKKQNNILTISFLSFLFLGFQFCSYRNDLNKVRKMAEIDRVISEEGQDSVYAHLVTVSRITDTLLSDSKKALVPTIIYVPVERIIRDTLYKESEIAFTDTTYHEYSDTIDRTKVIFPPKTFVSSNENYYIKGQVNLTGVDIDSLVVFPQFKWDFYEYKGKTYKLTVESLNPHVSYWDTTSFKIERRLFKTKLQVK